MTGGEKKTNCWKIFLFGCYCVYSTIVSWLCIK